MALTRNDECVHEKRNLSERRFQQSSCTAFRREDIDLRIFLNHWKFAFAVWKEIKKAFSSLEKTDWLHKIYLTKTAMKLLLMRLLKNSRLKIRISHSHLKQ
jgi:putative hemin transport protein